MATNPWERARRERKVAALIAAILERAVECGISTEDALQAARGWDSAMWARAAKRAGVRVPSGDTQRRVLEELEAPILARRAKVDAALAKRDEARQVQRGAVANLPPSREEDPFARFADPSTDRCSICGGSNCRSASHGEEAAIRRLPRYRRAV